MNNPLIGKTIQNIKIAEDKLALLFVLDNEECLVVGVDTDCCSYMWVESVEMPVLGFPATVFSVRDLEMPDLGDLPGCDVVAYYGCEISTNKGAIVIDYRNDSNGYYGGNLSWPGDHHYGGVYGQADSSHNWQDIV